MAAPFVLRATSARAAPSRVRRNASTMAPDDPFFADYAQAVQAMHTLFDKDPNDPLNWRNQALIHLNHCTHGAIDFVHWHRWYLSYFEKICGALIGKPNFALAYWNWEEATSNVPNPFFDQQLLNVTYWKDPSNAQSDNWSPARITTVGIRGIARGQTMLSMPRYSRNFNRARLSGISAQRDFEIFTNQLESGPHGSAHLAVGLTSSAPFGHMSDGVSSLDPIFWLHHCNIDRIWGEWEAAGNVTSDPGNSYANNFFDENRKPVQNANSTGAIPLSSFDYTYDTLESSVVTSNARRLQLEGLVGGEESPLARLKLTKPRTLASAKATGELKINAITTVPVEIPNLVNTLGETRVFRAPEPFGLPRNAIEPTRLVAKIEGVVPPKDPAVSVGVFVNCPYLTPDTPSYDPTSAGVITFFGVHADHQRTYYVDLSDALRTLGAEGRIATNKVSVQLLPVGLAESTPSDITLGQPKVTILST